VGAGSAAAVDQKLILNGQLPVSIGKYGISAVTVRQFLNKCLVYDGAAYTDLSAEADSLAGTPFDLLGGTDDFVYFGKATKFKELYLDLAVNGNYTGVAWEYWGGSAWQPLVTGGAGHSLNADGKVNWTIPADWATTIVNSSDPLFWVRVKCTAVTIIATCNCARQNAVQNTDYIVDPGQVANSLLNGRIGRLAAGFPGNQRLHRARHHRRPGTAAPPFLKPRPHGFLSPTTENCKACLTPGVTLCYL